MKGSSIKTFLAFLFLSTLTHARDEKWPIHLDLECGTYQGSGVLEINKSGQIILTANKSTTNQTEIIILGGNTDLLLKNNSVKVALNFYVPKKMDGNNRPFVFFQKFVELKNKNPMDYLTFVKPEPCGLSKKFAQDD